MARLTPEERRQQLLMDYKSTFASQQGLRVLADLRRFLLADRQTFISERPDETAFNCGVREAWLYIERQIKRDSVKVADRQTQVIDTEGDEDGR